MQKLSSTKLKEFAALKLAKHRREAGIFVAEGIKLIVEALQHHQTLQHLIVTNQVYARLTAADAPEYAKLLLPKVDYTTDDNSFSRLSELNSPEGLIGYFKLPDTVPFIIRPQLGTGFVLWAVQDPGNVGAILRVAAWFGLDAVYCSPGTADLYNPKTLRAAMGAAFQVPVVPLQEAQILAPEFLAQCVLADMQGENLAQFNWSAPKLIILGNEGNGLPPVLKNLDLPTVAIPHYSGFESLNVAVSAGILAYDLRQKLGKV